MVSAILAAALQYVVPVHTAYLLACQLSSNFKGNMHTYEIAQSFG